MCVVFSNQELKGEKLKIQESGISSARMQRTPVIASEINTGKKQQEETNKKQQCSYSFSVAERKLQEQKKLGDERDYFSIHF